MATAAPEIPVLTRDQDFETLYRRYVKDVYHYALALLRNPDDAEDVTQTTFMNAYRAYQRGIEIEKPQNWLIKIAHNVARTRYARAGRRVKEVPLEDHVEQLSVPEAERPDVTSVLRALGRLPFNQRAALVMRELEGRSYAEIADTIGVSVSAVETLIFRARKSLRLRASALRALAAVPLPSSLTQLLQGGEGALAGGGAVVGTGFLIKAAGALGAGVVATGVGAERKVSATAAASPPALQQASRGADGLMVRPAGSVGGKRAPISAWARVGNGSTSRGGMKRKSPSAYPAPLPQRPPAPAAASPAPAGAAPSRAASPVATTAQVPSEASTTLAATVESAVAAAPAAAPVQVPSLPPVKVDIPTIPVAIPLP
jgi:RNA polymerase sigma factor (sigma-70 family)